MRSLVEREQLGEASSSSFSPVSGLVLNQISKHAKKRREKATAIYSVCECKNDKYEMCLIRWIHFKGKKVLTIHQISAKF